jgi:hypothetical protein
LILTYSGLYMDPLNPKPEDISILDIAHALSMLTRANGHFSQFFSVAQHSINCAEEARARGYSPRVVLGALLHDAGEAYLADITRPVKARFGQYLQAEQKLDRVIGEHFSLCLTCDEYTRIRAIDDDMLPCEFLHLHPRYAGDRRAEWDDMGNDKSGQALLSDPCAALSSVPDFSFRQPGEVKEHFLSLYNSLAAPL